MCFLALKTPKKALYSLFIPVYYRKAELFTKPFIQVIPFHSPVYARPRADTTLSTISFLSRSAIKKHVNRPSIFYLCG